MTLFSNPLVLDLLAMYKPIAAMTHASSLLGWDLEINMPEAGAAARGQAQAEIELLRQKMTLGLAGLIEKAEKQKTLNDAEKGVIRIIKRELDFYQKIPAVLLEKLQKATVEASVPWREARKKADFRIFQPHLEKITDLKRKQAEYLNPSTHPYNALLDLFEEGLTIDDLDKIFSVLIPQLKKILAKTLAQGKFPEKHPLEEADYDVEALKQVNQKLTSMLDMPGKRFRQDVSTHPFSIRIAGDDVRITTRYEPKNFKASMFGLIHECGHALYELQVDHQLDFTPTGTGVSSGVHESQSRFWENIVGRSRQFTSMTYPLLKTKLSFLSRYDENQVYSYFNALEHPHKETATSNSRRQEHPSTQGMARRKRPQTGSNISTKGTAQPSLRPWIRPVGSCKLSRKQVPHNELSSLRGKLIGGTQTHRPKRIQAIDNHP